MTGVSTIEVLSGDIETLTLTTEVIEFAPSGPQGPPGTGGSGGAVDSVNGRTGAVTLTKTDVGLNNVDNTSDVNKPVSTAQAAADTAVANTASSALSAHVAAADPHTQYVLETTTVNGQALSGNVTITNITGNAATVTTNANLTGPVTSTGNATAIANGAISNSMLANAAVANLSGMNTGDETGARVATLLHAASNKTTLIDADEVNGTDSAASFGLIRTTWTNVKAFLKTYFDTLYPSGSGSSTGTNTGDNAVNTLYSGLVTNATHTGDATGATALTLATVNSNVGSFTNANITVNAKGLVTAAANGSGGGGGLDNFTAHLRQGII